jgi:hypothetical protein
VHTGSIRDFKRAAGSRSDGLIRTLTLSHRGFGRRPTCTAAALRHRTVWLLGARRAWRGYLRVPDDEARSMARWQRTAWTMAAWMARRRFSCGRWARIEGARVVLERKRSQKLVKEERQREGNLPVQKREGEGVGVYQGRPRSPSVPAGWQACARAAWRRGSSERRWRWSRGGRGFLQARRASNRAGDRRD